MMAKSSNMLEVKFFFFVNKVSGTERKLFKVNRPFIFYIYDSKNNVPIFIGRIFDPTGQNT